MRSEPNLISGDGAGEQGVSTVTNRCIRPERSSANVPRGTVPLPKNAKRRWGTTTEVDHPPLANGGIGVHSPIANGGNGDSGDTCGLCGRVRLLIFGAAVEMAIVGVVLPTGPGGTSPTQVQCAMSLMAWVHLGHMALVEY